MTSQKNQINTKFTLGFFAITAFIAIASRWMPHAPNFSALGGFLFFGGFLGFKNRAILPLALGAMIATDLILGAYPGIEFVYGAYVLILAIGFLAAYLKSRLFEMTMWNVWAAFLFFVLSNLGVYYFGGLYPQTTAGLRDCFIMALPFFGNTIAAQIIFGLSFVYAYRFLAAKFSVAVEAKSA